MYFHVLKLYIHIMSLYYILTQVIINTITIQYELQFLVKHLKSCKVKSCDGLKAFKGLLSSPHRCSRMAAENLFVFQCKKVFMC